MSSNPSPRYFTREDYERAYESTEHELADQILRVGPHRIKHARRWEDHERMCVVYELDGQRACLDWQVVKRIVGPAPSPMVEAFYTVGMALHEADKARQRTQDEIDRLMTLFGPEPAEVRLYDHTDPRAAVVIGSEIIRVDCYYDAARNLAHADAIAAAHNTGMFRTQDSLVEAMPALRESFGTPPAPSA